MVRVLSEFFFTVDAPEPPMGMSTAAQTRTRSAPRPIDPLRTIPLLQTQVESQRGEGENQRNGDRDAVQVALDDCRTRGRRTHGATEEVRDAATAPGVQKDQEHQPDRRQSLNCDECPGEQLFLRLAPWGYPCHRNETR